MSSVPRAVAIVGPEKVKPGRMAAFQLKGLPAESLNAFDWIVFNKPDDAVVLDLADRRTGEPVLVFQSETPGKYALIADVNVLPLEDCQLLVHEFVVGEPNPPPPPPPPPNKVTFGRIVEERDNHSKLPIEQVWVIDSSKVRALFDAGNFQVRDDDVEDEKDKAPPEWVPFIKRARDVIGLPALFLMDSKGQVVWEGPVPADVTKALN